MEQTNEKGQCLNYDSFRALLVNEFEKRKEKNSSYSLRAYANFLLINPACLSVILRGKRPLTAKLVQRFSNRLNLSPEDLSHITSTAEKGSKANYEIMTFEMFQMLSEWHYDAICELVKLDGFRNDSKWISAQLNVDVTKVNIAIERLLKYDFLSKDEFNNLHLEKADNDLHVDDFTDVALRKLQEKALELSKDAINSVNIESRFHGTMTMAIDQKKLPEAKKELRKFKQKFCTKIQNKSDSCNAVYQLQLSFFPLTNKERIQK